MNAVATQTIAEIEADAQRRISAIRQAHNQAAQVTEQNRLSEQRKAELAAQAETREQSRLQWVDAHVPGLQAQFAALAEKAAKLKEINQQIDRLFDDICELHPVLRSEVSTFAGAVVQSRCSLQDVAVGLVDIETVVESALDDVVDTSTFAVYVNPLVSEKMRNRLGLGANAGIDSSQLWTEARHAAAQVRKRLGGGR